MNRPYTGNSDGIALGVRKGLTVFINQMLVRFPALWNNGDFGVRMMRGSKESLSVHATGRAVDLSWRFMPNHKDGSATKGIKEGGRKQAMLAADFAVKNATVLGLECVLDYFPSPYGRGYRCDRNGWQVYTTATIHGSPMGDWLHFELSPKMSDDADAMRAVFAAIDKSS